MNRSRLTPLVLIAAVVAGGYVLYSMQRADEPVITPAPVQAPAVTEPTTAALPESAPLPLPVPETSPAKAPGYIAYPDGTFYPPLNGVKVAPKIIFHSKFAPFAKVVGQIRDARGREWYVHENGVRSTTYINSAGLETYEVEKDMPPAAIVPEEHSGGRGK